MYSSGVPEDLPDDTAPRWLTEGERAAWLELGRVVVTLPAALDLQLRRTADLSLYEYRVLGVLSEQPDRRMGLKALASLTNGSLSRLSHVVTRLENAGLLCRCISPHDGRCTEAVLTDQGRQRVVGAAPGHVQAVRELVFGAINEDEAALLADLLTRIAPDVDHPVARYHAQLK